jgi:hypothetical protein
MCPIVQIIANGQQLPVMLFLTILFRMQYYKRKSAMWDKLRDGIFPLTAHADESMVYL